jgi:hypothetical protein
MEPFRLRNLQADHVFERLMRSRIARFALITGAALACTATAIAAVQPEASSSRSIVLGKTPSYPQSGCPATDACEVVARVTGIQMRAAGVDHPFRVPATGQLVAWWLKLPNMRPAQISTFNSLFGGDPVARIAVLRRGVRGRFRLVRQSANQPLRGDLGQSGRVRYRLTEPLRVKEGDYIGLTAVTWVPAFAVSLDAAGNAWRASRPKRRCATPPSSSPKRFKEYYRLNDAQLDSSTAKEYRCSYQTARLLYWARIVPDAPAGAAS